MNKYQIRRLRIPKLCTKTSKILTGIAYPEQKPIRIQSESNVKTKLFKTRQNKNSKDL